MELIKQKWHLSWLHVPIMSVIMKWLWYMWNKQKHTTSTESIQSHRVLPGILLTLLYNHIGYSRDFTDSQYNHTGYFRNFTDSQYNHTRYSRDFTDSSTLEETRKHRENCLWSHGNISMHKPCIKLGKLMWSVLHTVSPVFADFFNTLFYLGKDNLSVKTLEYQVFFY